MVKITFCIRRLPTLSREQFFAYWHGHHAALARKNQHAMGFVKYVQLHAADTPFNEVMRKSRGAPAGFDGVAELWWETAADMEAAFASPEGRAASKELLEDEKNFIDIANSPIWVSDEKPIV
jgi:uncharacterized protein (TIGR02118 family)